MAYVETDQEVYKYVGGVFRAAAEHPEAGPNLRSAGVTLQLRYTNPAAVLTVKFDESMEVIEGETDVQPDVQLYMESDIADKYWRGEYNLAVGLAKGKVKAKGPVNKILKLVPLTKPLFPMYRELTAAKDRTAAAA
jgi:putative sterol carrier protein